MNDQLPTPSSNNTFERIKRLNPQGNECWSARDLARVLEYLNFRNFQPVIEKAKEACAKSGHAVADHFAEMRNMVGIGSGAQRELEDWALSRYACYLVIQNADPSKPLVALGQSYFAVHTRRQELADDEALKEDNTRLLLRAEMKKHNKNLASVAKQAGVIQPVDYAIFMDHGYRGLYGGLGMRDIRERKRLKDKQHVLAPARATRLENATGRWPAAAAVLLPVRTAPPHGGDRVPPQRLCRRARNRDRRRPRHPRRAAGASVAAIPKGVVVRLSCFQPVYLLAQKNVSAEQVFSPLTLLDGPGFACSAAGNPKRGSALQPDAGENRGDAGSYLSRVL